MRSLLVIGVSIGLLQFSALSQTSQPSADAASLYLQAAKVVTTGYRAGVMSPSASNLDYNNRPPYPDEWYRLEKGAYAANGEARALAHKARLLDTVNWPVDAISSRPLNYLNPCRSLCNDLADAAILQHLQGDDGAAVETVQDLWHLADMVSVGPKNQLVCFLVSVGIRASDVDRLMIITSSINLSKDPHDIKALQVATARDVIAELLKHDDAKSIVDAVLRKEAPGSNIFTGPEFDRLLETVKRVNAERDLAAMSLACHLYHFDTGAWPKTFAELKAYLPTIPVDPWGDGKQTLGYAVIKGGLPDGADRPLVYSRDRMNGRLFFRIDEPQYTFYSDDGTDRPINQRTWPSGQFRDVASWVSPEGKHTAPPTTQPLE